MSQAETDRQLPLHGLKVVELGDSVAGPYCARLLADAGAEVIKVEAPEGDASRRRGPFPDDLPDPNRSGLFLYLNANKLGISMDVRSSLGKELFRDLLRDADILVENNAPRTMQELGLDFASLHEDFPNLIVTSVTPFGQTGPYRDYHADDLIAMNMGGMAYATPGLPDEVSDVDREPPLRPATYVADFAAAISASVATMLAILTRESDGLGRHVDVSAQEAVAAAMAWDLTTLIYLGVSKQRGTRLGYGLMPNCYLPCKDGYVVLTAFYEDHWTGLVEVMGSPDWAESGLFDDAVSRADHWDALRLLLLDWTMSHTGREISEATQARGIPCFPARELDQAVDEEQLSARGFLQEIELGAGRRARMPGLPFRFGDNPWPLRMPAPRLGEHTNVLLSERLGLSGAELARLNALGVI